MIHMNGRDLGEQLRGRMQQILQKAPEPRPIPEWAAGDLLQQQLAGRPGLCRLCDERATLQLSPGRVAPGVSNEKYAQLCSSHLGDFIETWSDPRITEWIINRL